MKIVQINCSSNGSTGTLARAIHEALRERGDESRFFYGIGPDAGEGTQAICTPLECRLHTYAGRITGLHGYFSHLRTKSLLRRLEAIHPDIVHLHNLHGGYLNVGMLLGFLRIRKIPTLLTLHDCWMFTGGCPFYSDAGCMGWLNGCGSCPQMHTYPRRWLDSSRKCLRDKRRWTNGMDGLHIAAVSRWLAEEAGKSFLGNHPIHTIYNGIDTAVFQPTRTAVRRKYGIPEDAFMILGVSSLWNVPRKGLPTFLALRRQLPQNHVIVLVGLNEAQSKQLPAGIIAIGRTENPRELAALYTAADVFLHAGTEEAFGLIIAEALACGTPAIVSDSTACPEIIDDASGRAVNMQDLDALCAAITEIREKRPFTLEDCRSRSCRNFSRKKMIPAYLEVYAEMLEVRPQP